MAHVPSFHIETRKGMRFPEFRVTCTCGWQDKALTEQEAKSAHTRHVNRPTRA